MVRQRPGRHRRQATGVGPARRLADAAGGEHAQAGDGEPFRTGQRQIGRSVPVAPVGTGAAIQQHRDDGQFEAAAGPRVAVLRHHAPGKLGPEVAAGQLEMAPAAMQRHPGIGIGGPRHLSDQIGGLGQAFRDQAEVRRLAHLGERQQLVGTLADRFRRQQLGQCSPVAGCRHQPSSRPRVRVSSPSLGAGAS